MSKKTFLAATQLNGMVHLQSSQSIKNYYMSGGTTVMRTDLAPFVFITWHACTAVSKRIQLLLLLFSMGNPTPKRFPL